MGALQDAGAHRDGDRVRCPFHADEHASGGIHEQNETWWYTCHGCTWNGRKKTGDVVDVVRRARKLDFRDALEALGVSGNGRAAGGAPAACHATAPGVLGTAETRHGAGNGLRRENRRWRAGRGMRRATENPLAGLDPLNVRTDRRRDRRALSVDALRALLDTTDSGPERFGMIGTERAMMYRLAVETGLRANGLRTLTRASFDLDGAEPTVTVAAAYSKHRREDVLPLRPELAMELRAFMIGLAPAAQVFKLPADRHSAASMFQDDIKAAGVRYVDDAGRYADFHSLRHTFITNLANGGVHPKVAQALARHSTITLTMDRYSHVVRGDQATALAVLPDLSGPAREQARATGTDSARAVTPHADSRLALCLAQKGRRNAIRVDASGRRARDKRGAGNSEILGENANLPATIGSWRGARVADAAGLENRCG